MNTATITSPLTALMSELVYGAKPQGNFMLNGGDVGLLRALDELSAAEASQIVNGGSTIAAHVDHVAYYTRLMNRWAEGQGLWDGADWTASWRRAMVDEEGWIKLRRSFADEVEKWMGVLKQPRDVNDRELATMIATIAHLAYHLGAIRQMNRNLRGPSAEQEQAASTSPAPHL
jgi:hypothetical protein